jgi:cbb3-type cytochrome oxidase subunit 1
VLIALLAYLFNRFVGGSVFLVGVQDMNYFMVRLNVRGKKVQNNMGENWESGEGVA